MKGIRGHMISIIVPVYNAEKYISQAMDTVIRQTYQDWELILVDDCSQDDSVRVMEEKLREYSDKGGASERIRIIKKKINEGAAKARNTGLDHAQGRYIAFLDADDVWYPDKLRSELDFMELRDAGFVYTSYKFGDENAIPTGKVARVPRKLSYKEALSQTIIFTSTVLIDTRKVDRQLIYMPDMASEDTATWWRILKTGVVAYGLDEQLVIYRRPAASLSADKKKAVRRIWNLYREIAGLSVVESLVHLFGWAWTATMRRVLDDAVRRHLESIKRFTVLQMSLLGLVLHTLIYAWIWFVEYYPLISAVRISQDGYVFGGGLKLYFRGHLVILGIYFLLLLFLSRSNGSMKTGYAKPEKIWTSQMVALGMTNVITYAQLSLMRNWLLPWRPLLYAFALQILLTLLWSYLAYAIYRKVFPPRETLIILGEDNGDAVKDILMRFQNHRDKFEICKSVSVSEGLEAIERECLRWYGCVVISGVYGLLRKELIDFCYTHYIRMYVIPELSDLVIQGSQQMDLLDTPILELKEYNISWEERLFKRGADIVIASFILVLTSPVFLYRLVMGRIVRQPILERTVCLSKDGREFVCHTFRSRGFGWSLPMFYDVLRGSISLVGPEVLPADQAKKLINTDHRFFYRYRVKAGYMGYATSLGSRFNAKLVMAEASEINWKEAKEILKLDIVYIQHYSLLQDFRLIMGMFNRKYE